jgi:N-methylhydantoinase A
MLLSVRMAQVPTVGIDVGGTFTDLALIVDGEMRLAKVPSTPDDQSLGVADAIAAARLSGPMLLAHATTVATNALLERRGARTALVTTEGFRDVIEIGRQVRFDLYDLSARRPAPLVPRDLRFTVRERTGPEGIVVPLDPHSVEACLEALAATEVEAVAVCLLFAFSDPTHERAVAAAIRHALPGVHVSLSSEVLPEYREYERFSTTVVDAFLAPEMKHYLSRLVARTTPLGATDARVMQSSGGVTSVDEAMRLPASCVLSGPSGGVVGAWAVASELGHHNVLTMDIGGTSADVAVIIDGNVVVTNERTVAGAAIRLPMLDIKTISAGGGSIVSRDPAGGIRVGPRSAGADPGPACYGHGGTSPTLTDANLVLGYLADGQVLGERIRLDLSQAEEALAAVAEPVGLSVPELAAGVARITAANIAQALREITIERGLDPRGFALVAFGGAGAMHACAVADELHLDEVVVPLAGGVLSALGLAIADMRADCVRTVLLDGEDVNSDQLEAVFVELEHELDERLPGATLRRQADVRYRRQGHELTVSASALPELVNGFHALHEQRYGNAVRTEPVLVVNARVTATREQLERTLAKTAMAADGREQRAAWFDGTLHEATVVQGIAPDSLEQGPAIVELEGSTCVVPPGWVVSVGAGVALRLVRSE